MESAPTAPTAPPERPPERYKGEAIARAVRALAALAEEPGLGLAELAARTGVPKATLAGILNTLVAHDWLSVATSKGYRLGYAWLRFADARRSQSSIRERALPVMRRIRDALDETVILSLKVGDRRVHLDYIESTQSVRRIAQPGQEAPLHVGAAGLVLLAGLGETGIEAYLARATEAVDAAAVRRAVAEVKRDGYAAAAGTVNPDTAAVAAPVRAYSGETVASLAVSCPRDRFTEELRKACIAAVTEGARTLSRALGFAA
jgi:DNA-binding IclR family transcriptional regulator